MKNIRILLAEDEDQLRKVILKYLEKEGYEGLGAANGEEALDLFIEKQPDCVILDVNMPIMDGFEVLEEIRKNDNTPVIMLTARREEDDKITGFESGADDYVTKPFSPRELMVRLKALLKRSGLLSIEKEIKINGIVIEHNSKTVFVDGVETILTAKEYAVLMYLINHQKMILAREQIVDRIWGFDFDGDYRVVDTTIKRLRKKLGERGSCIQTVRGMGYKLEE
ncbi:MAG: response regulator transcription factor [Eubacterium sp.]